jgi:hypothetical protein
MPLLLNLSVDTPPAGGVDAMDRMPLDNLRRVHDAVQSLKSERRQVSLSSGFQDVRALLHVHSALSHDSRGTLTEIVTAAKDAQARVIMFSEHPANTYDYFLDGHRGIEQGVLLIPGAETGGFLAYPRQSIQSKPTTKPQDFANLVRSSGGLVFISHLEERMDWEIANVTGTEIYNTHADFKTETRFLDAMRSPLSMLNMAAAAKHYPQEVFGALLDYPADYLKRYDELCLKARLTGISANDAHHNQAYRAKILDEGIIQLEDALGEKIARLDAETIPPLKLLTVGRKAGDVIFELDLDPYVCSFRHVSTHLLLTEVDEAHVWQALSDGRAYVAFDWMADPTGFVYQATCGDNTWPLGSDVPFQSGLHLQAEAPLAGRIRLLRDGHLVTEVVGRTLDHAADRPGNYRVEVWLRLGAEDRPWILSNPIYLRPSGS